jgi:DNA anti-recombination protein RmuC
MVDRRCALSSSVWMPTCPPTADPLTWRSLKAKERPVVEGDGLTDEMAASAPAEPRGYAALGERVAGILEAAERAAEQIRRDAKQQASEQDRAARADAERLTKELTEEARSLHAEAEEYARDMRQAVEAYATQHRRQAEEEGRKIVAEAERQASTVREAAEQTVRQVEGDIRRRQEKLKAQVRLLEERRREALEQLREVAALVQEVLPATEREESMIGALRPERGGASATGS